VVTLGDTEMLGVVAPVLQRNDVPPAAVSMCDPPGQMVTGGQMVHVGPGVTVTVAEHVLLQLPLDTVTVYVVVRVGFTVMEAVVAPVLHRNDAPPDAVSVTGAPAQTEELDGVMLQVGGLPVCVTTTSAKQLSVAFTELVIVKRYVPG